jgi:hypothetical protein
LELAMTHRALLFAASLACSTPLAAQFVFIPRTGHSSSWAFDLGAQFVRPVGEFRVNVPRAWGVGASARYNVLRSPLALRADMTWLNYGNESRRVPLSSTVNRVMVNMRTANNISLVTIGPELSLNIGPLEPYAQAFYGYSSFYTESSVAGKREEDVASSTNYRDEGEASGWGSGLRIPIHSRRHSVAIDAGARFTRAGTRTYLTRGDVQDQPDGSLTFTPKTSATDFWQAHIGATFSSRR